MGRRLPRPQPIQWAILEAVANGFQLEEVQPARLQFQPAAWFKPPPPSDLALRGMLHNGWLVKRGGRYLATAAGFRHLAHCPPRPTHDQALLLDQLQRGCYIQQRGRPNKPAFHVETRGRGHEIRCRANARTVNTLLAMNWLVPCAEQPERSVISSIGNAVMKKRRLQ